MPRAMQAHSFIEEAPRQVDVGQPKANKCLRCILGQPPVAGLVEAPQPLDHCKDVLHLRAHTRLAAVDQPRNLFALVPAPTRRPLACKTLPTLATLATLPILPTRLSPDLLDNGS